MDNLQESFFLYYNNSFGYWKFMGGSNITNFNNKTIVKSGFMGA